MDRDDIEALILRVGQADRAAFDGLYTATSAKLLGVCLRILGERSAAEDAVQDTYIKIWKHADRYAVNGLSPMTWLITIARNTAIDRLRRGGGHESHGAPDIVFDLAVAPGPSPEAAALARSEAERIAACLGELEPDRREAVKRAYLDGWSYAALAERFDVPLNTMRTWLRRGLIALRACMSR